MSKKINQSIKLKFLDSKLELIYQLRNLIKVSFSDLFHSVIIHGSIATDEVISYSDFDGLLIVKDKWIASKELKNFINKSLHLIYRFDPLQHHGWFIIKESELLDYPETYLPCNVLKYSKVIYPEVNLLELKLIINKKVDYKSSLLKMLDNFEVRQQKKWKAKNMYQLKSFLSQIMLIPSMYYSALRNEGIFKKKSFDAVRSYFNNEEWNPIVVSSSIRQNWDNKMSVTKTALFSVSNTYFRKLVTLLLAPKIPKKFSKQLDEEFYLNLSKMVTKIKNDIS